MAGNFTERRKEHRLPFDYKIIFSDGIKSIAAYALNLSRGGTFVRTLQPFPIDTRGLLLFIIPGKAKTLCLKGKVVHVVFDRQRCEVDNGMGIQFQELSDSQRTDLNEYVSDQQAAYLSLQKLVNVERPNFVEMEPLIRSIPSLKGLDLLGLRYRINRVCTIFEAAPTEALSA